MLPWRLETCFFLVHNSLLHPKLDTTLLNFFQCNEKLFSLDWPILTIIPDYMPLLDILNNRDLSSITCAYVTWRKKHFSINSKYTTAQGNSTGEQMLYLGVNQETNSAFNKHEFAIAELANNAVMIIDEIHKTRDSDHISISSQSCLKDVPTRTTLFLKQSSYIRRWGVI